MHRLLAQNSDLGELSAVQQHAHEPAIVLRGRIQATVTSKRRCWCRWNRLPRRLFLENSIGMAVAFYEPRLLLRGNRIRRIDHSQRTEDVLLVIRFQRLAGDLLDNQP